MRYVSEVLHHPNGMEHDRLRLYVLKLAVGTLRNFKNSRSKKVQNSLVSTQLSRKIQQVGETRKCF